MVRKKHDNIRLYHVDHLGSTTLVTDIDGEVTQHVAYIPYGEVFVEQRNGSWNTPYLFNAKELDEETGLYYYGARYLDPTHAAWLSVDPMFEKYVGMTPYGYCAGNPVGLVDVDGEDIYMLDEISGRLSLVEKNEESWDQIRIGTYDHMYGWKADESRKNDALNISKGILNSNDKREDLSVKGIHADKGEAETALKLMEFISFNVYKELSAWGYVDEGDKFIEDNYQLEIEPWYKNTFRSSKNDKFSGRNKFPNMGKKLRFHIHTHCGDRDASPGFGNGTPSSQDLEFTKGRNNVLFFIDSRKEGLTRYDRTRTYKKLKKDDVPSVLRQFIKQKK